MLIFVTYALINFRSPYQNTISIDHHQNQDNQRQDKLAKHAKGSASTGIEGIGNKLYQSYALCCIYVLYLIEILCFK